MPRNTATKHRAWAVLALFILCVSTPPATTAAAQTRRAMRCGADATPRPDLVLEAEHRVRRIRRALGLASASFAVAVAGQGMTTSQMFRSDGSAPVFWTGVGMLTVGFSTYFGFFGASVRRSRETNDWIRRRGIPLRRGRVIAGGVFGLHAPIGLMFLGAQNRQTWNRARECWGTDASPAVDAAEEPETRTRRRGARRSGPFSDI